MDGLIAVLSVFILICLIALTALTGKVAILLAGGVVTTETVVAMLALAFFWTSAGYTVKRGLFG